MRWVEREDQLHGTLPILERLARKSVHEIQVDVDKPGVTGCLNGSRRVPYLSMPTDGDKILFPHRLGPEADSREAGLCQGGQTFTGDGRGMGFHRDLDR